MIETHTILPGDVRSIDVESKFTPDPSAATPYFALSVKGVKTPGTYAAGAWKSGSTWSSITGHIEATTPTIGATGSLATTAGVDYWVWQKVTVGSETFVDICMVVTC